MQVLADSTGLGDDETMQDAPGSPQHGVAGVYSLCCRLSITRVCAC